MERPTRSLASSAGFLRARSGQRRLLWRPGRDPRNGRARALVVGFRAKPQGRRYPRVRRAYVLGCDRVPVLSSPHFEPATDCRPVPRKAWELLDIRTLRGVETFSTT